MIQLHFIIEVHGHATHRKNGGGHFVNFFAKKGDDSGCPVIPFLGTSPFFVLKAVPTTREQYCIAQLWRKTVYLLSVIIGRLGVRLNNQLSFSRVTYCTLNKETSGI